jgi:anti-anti-sigma factor
MRIDEQGAELTRVTLAGRLDTAGVDQVETRLTAAVATPRKNAIIDLSEVEFLSSMGIRMLLTLAKALDRAGARLVLVAPRPLVDEALRHSALDELIPVAADASAAEALLVG